MSYRTFAGFSHFFGRRFAIENPLFDAGQILSRLNFLENLK